MNILQIVFKGLAEKQRILAIKKHKTTQFSKPVLRADSMEQSHFESTGYSNIRLLFKETRGSDTAHCSEPDKPMRNRAPNFSRYKLQVK